ncbi:MAG: hypothetical protein AAFO17_17045 [Pseudomonadota bacterium]
MGMGYVRCSEDVAREYVLSGNYELEVAGERVPCDVHLEPLYDPEMSRMKS